jgi:hypothetical protein
MRSLALCIVLVLALPARAQFVGGSVVPGGAPLTVAVPPGATDTLHVVYRPGAATLPQGETIMRPPGAQSWTWQPARAGVVRLASGEAQQNVSVRYDTFPVGGLLVMLLAGLILFGGIAFSMRTLMRS